MPSFDIASKVDLQTLDNAVNIAKKEIDNRYDFKGTHVTFELNKKDMTIEYSGANNPLYLIRKKESGPIKCKRNFHSHP